MVVAKLPGADGILQEVHIPAITLVPHQGILIDEVEVEMKVKLSDSTDEKRQQSKKTKQNKKDYYRFFQ